jgi:tetratricopeptide (TPR) repeat protein
MSDVFQYNGAFDRSVAELRMSIDADPSPHRLASHAFNFYGAGLVAEGLAAVEEALLAFPAHPGWMDRYQGLGYYLIGNYSRAAEMFSRPATEGADPKGSSDVAVSLVFLVASLSAAGQMDEARRCAQSLMAADPAFSAHDWSQWYFGVFKDRELAPAIEKRLRAAGLPE